MDQGAGLVVFRLGERDAEFHRRQRDAALDDGALAVEGDGRLPPGGIVGRSLELLDDPADDVVFHRLVVRRQVAPLAAVEIELADFQRVLAERIGDVFDHPLAADHALRSAEPPERGVRDRVGLQRARAQPNIRVEIAVVGVEERAVGHRSGKVGEKPQRAAKTASTASMRPSSSKRPCSRRGSRGACPSPSCRRRGRGAP